MMFCDECGAPLKEGSKFCTTCGAKTEVRGQAQDAVPQNDNEIRRTEIIQQTEVVAQHEIESNTVVIPQTVTVASQPEITPQPGITPQPENTAQTDSPTEQIQYTAPQQYSAPQPVAVQTQPAKKKMSGGLLALIIILPIVVVLALGGFGVYWLFIRNVGADPIPVVSTTPKDEPIIKDDPVNTSQPALSENIDLPDVSYTYLGKQPEAIVEFTAVDSIFPSMYRTMDSLVVFTGYCDYGELDVMVEVEVPGFTQSYKQKVTLGWQVTKLRIIPPLMTGEIDLNSEKTAQLIYSVTEVDTGRTLVQESRNLKLYSKFDMVWGDEYDWDAYTDNILAWMTPDAPEILQLKRDAIDYLDYISDGQLTSLVGYQDYNFFDDYYYNTWVQAVAIQGAMSDITQVRYNNSLFSMDAEQRVKLPADTLNSRSGLCIETALVMASALQSTGMHVMLIFPPGHAQVAVEAWYGAGDYFLIETTVLPMEQNMDAWNYTVMYMDRDEWLGYITGEGYFTYGPCYVVDCDLGEKLGIRAMSN